MLLLLVGRERINAIDGRDDAAGAHNRKSGRDYAPAFDERVTFFSGQFAQRNRDLDEANLMLWTYKDL